MDEDLEQLARNAAADPTDEAAARRYDAALARSGRQEELRERFGAKFLCPVLWSDLETMETPAERFCESCSRLVAVTEDRARLVEHVREGRCVAVAHSSVATLLDALARDASLDSASESNAPCIVSGAPVPAAVPRELLDLVGRTTAQRLGFAPVDRSASTVFIAIGPDTPSTVISYFECRVRSAVETTLVSRRELDALIASLRDEEDVRDPEVSLTATALHDVESRAWPVLPRNDPQSAARILGEELERRRPDVDRRMRAWAHGERARLLALAGGAADAALAREELARAQELEPNNESYALWLAAIFGVTTPLLETTARESRWPAPVAAFLLGEIAAPELLGQVRIGPHRSEANWFVGVTHDRDGHAAEARKAYERCVRVGLTDGIQRDWAVARLESGGPAPWKRA
jgi:hypothetical protein